MPPHDFCVKSQIGWGNLFISDVIIAHVTSVSRGPFNLKHPLQVDKVKLLLPCKRSLEQDNVVTPVYHSVHRRGLCIMSLPVWLPDPMFLLGGLCPWSHVPFRWSLSTGLCPGGLYPEGSLSRRISVWGVCPEGVSVQGSEGSQSRGSLSRGSL